LRAKKRTLVTVIAEVKPPQTTLALLAKLTSPLKSLHFIKTLLKSPPIISTLISPPSAMPVPRSLSKSASPAVLLVGN
jgi:hypothetical protein